MHITTICTHTRGDVDQVDKASPERDSILTESNNSANTYADRAIVANVSKEVTYRAIVAGHHSRQLLAPFQNCKLVKTCM